MTQSNQPSILAVIPARYASTRFPGKPLALIQGKPMIQHVWERVQSVSDIQKVIIATDDVRIQEVAQSFHAEVRITSSEHLSGTDRIWEVAAGLPEFPWILNVQGDEPFINPSHLKTAIGQIEKHPNADIITLVTPLLKSEEWHDPNLVKAILSTQGQALYFSRAAVPYHRDAPDIPKQVYRHLGLYLYRRASLEQFTQLQASSLERIERLEQLRALEAGMSIYAGIVDTAPIGVDTPADLIRIHDS